MDVKYLKTELSRYSGYLPMYATIGVSIDKLRLSYDAVSKTMSWETKSTRHKQRTVTDIVKRLSKYPEDTIILVDNMAVIGLDVKPYKKGLLLSFIQCIQMRSMDNTRVSKQCEIS